MGKNISLSNLPLEKECDRDTGLLSDIHAGAALPSLPFFAKLPTELRSYAEL